jgi:microcystin-dependent protein
MATTDIEYVGVADGVDGINTDFSFPFPYLKIEHVKASIDAVGTTAFTIDPANPTVVSFTSAPTSGSTVRIFRQTPTTATPSVFFAGSSIRSSDLNDNFDSILYIMQEKEQGLQDIIQGGIADGSVSTAKLADDSVTSDKLRDDVSIDGNRAVTTNHIRDGAVTTLKIAADAVSMDKLGAGALPTDITVASANIVDGTIVDADVNASAAIAQSKLALSITDSEVNASAAIAGTKVSPDFGSQNITTTGSLTANGLSYPTSDGAADTVLKTDGAGTLSFGTLGGVPTGSVFYFAASTAPTGYLTCDGSSISRTTYADLFAVVGTTFGSVDGNTFNLPDLRGEFIRGHHGGSTNDPDYATRTFGSSQADELASHSHTVSNVCTFQGSIQDPPGSGNSHNNTYSLSTSSTGGAETRPRNVSLLPCIKT